MLPLTPAPAAPPAPWATEDVVVQARQQWAASCGQAPPAIGSKVMPSQPMPPMPSQPLPLGQPLGGLGDVRRQSLQREEPEIDPVSGLEV